MTRRGGGSTLASQGAWWRGAVIYQIYPRSFFDSNGDGIGDLPGIAGKLDYIAALGVDAVWISPFFASPMRDFGYDVADFRAVDPTFGTLGDFDRLVERAHALGLKVLIDQIWGHSSDRHPWFIESRASSENARADWYVWADPRPDGTPPNNWLSAFGGPAWSWEPRRRQFYLHHFLASQPTLNLRSDAVVVELLDVGRFWLDRGVDGFRLDAVDFFLHDPALRDNPAQPPPGGRIPAKLFGLQQHIHDMLHPDIRDVLRRIRDLMDRYPGCTTLAEVSSQAGAFERIGRYTEGDDQLHMAYTLQPSRGAFDRESVRRLLADAGNPRGWAAWSFSNHDVERAVSRWSSSAGASVDPDFARLLMGLMLSLRGSVSVYQHAWRQFLAWRKSHAALIEGDLVPVDAPAPLLAFRRSTGEESVLMVLNLSDEPAQLPEELLAGARSLTGHGFAETQGEHGATLPRYGMSFAAQEPAITAPARVLEPAR